jgi:hypothetical protein
MGSKLTLIFGRLSEDFQGIYELIIVSKLKIGGVRIASLPTQVSPTTATTGA